MWKVLIADDEITMRKALRSTISWNELEFEVVGEAEDGEIAFELAKELKPNLLLVDICMPFLNGLQLIEKLYEILPDSIVIVVTGYDEFSYAQQAIKLRVFEYLLKPILKEQLYTAAINARLELIQKQTNNKYIKWANDQLKTNLSYLKERFLNTLINGQMTDEEIYEQQEFLNLEVKNNSTLFIIKVKECFSCNEISKEWDRQLLLFAIKNITEELFVQFSSTLVFRDLKDNIVVIANGENELNAKEQTKELILAVEKYLKQTIIVEHGAISNGVLSVPNVYNSLLKEINKVENWSPVVYACKKYIDSNYWRLELSLQDVSNEFQISPRYLSRLLRQELGAAFIEYLSQVRIKNAILLMNDPLVKIYEVAEKVGYGSQHYFSTAFKKVLGVSPAEYRKGGER